MNARERRLRTWSSFGNLGRRPSEYEIVTPGMNHTMGEMPLELGPDVNGNRWLRAHRDAMKLSTPDWDAFRDPDAITYGSYVAMQDDQETYVEGLLEQFAASGHDVGLHPRVLDYLGLALTPCRYLVHGQQMLSAYVQQLAPGSCISTAATFQTADELRRVQLLAYRTVQLQRAHPGRAFGTGERAAWEGHPDWQAMRMACECALVEFDWDRAFAASQLVVKPVADQLFLQQLGRELATAGASLDGLIAENLWRDAQRSRRWITALLRLLVDTSDDNRSVLQGYLDEWAPRGVAMIKAGSRLLATAGGRTADEIAAAATAGWRSFLAPADLTVTVP